MENTWLITREDKLYYITETKLIDDVSEISDEAKQFILALTRQKDDVDLLWFSGTYCTANIRNQNGDGFKFDDLKENASKPQFKSVNWLHHDDEVVGVIVDSSFVCGEQKDTGRIQIIGVVWQATEKGRLYADKIREHYKKGTLGLSMECFGEEVECSVCGESFPIKTADRDNPYKHYCSHLKARRLDKSTVRWIRNPLFVGVGLIPAEQSHQPADDTAWVKEIASLQDSATNGKEVNEMAEKIYDQAQVDSLVEAACKQIKDSHDGKFASQTKELESLKEANETLKTDLAEANKVTEKVVELESEIEQMKAAKEGDDSVSAEDHEAVKSELTTKIAELEAKDAELQVYKDKEDAEITRKKAARIEELKEQGVELSEDLIESLSSHIVDDEKYEALKDTLVKQVEETPTAPKFESNRSVNDAATIIRELTNKSRN